MNSGCLIFAVCIGCVLCTEPARAELYVFTTIAGVPGIAGREDGTNHNALFSSPAGLALDAQGNLYVSEDGSHTIRKLTPAGGDWVVTTIAGIPGQSGSQDGTNGYARLNRPRGLAVDASGSLFVTDCYNSTIRRIDPVGSDWIASTIAGSAGVLEHQDGSFTNALFRRPAGIATGPAGTLLVADMNNHVIRLMEYVEPEWLVSTIAGFPFLAGSVDGTGDAAEFATPYSLVVVEDGTICVADTGNNAIREVQLSGGVGVVTTIAGSLGAPAGSIDGTGTSALFNFPAGITAGSSGALFVTDQLNHTIRKLTRANEAWTVTTIGGSPMAAGTNDGAGMAARFQRPWGIAADASGAVFVADTRNHTIRKGVPSGTPAAPSLQVSLGPAGVALSWPLSATGFVLENCTSLGGVWTEVSEPAVTGPDSFQVTVANSGSTAFFRLRKR